MGFSELCVCVCMQYTHTHMHVRAPTVKRSLEGSVLTSNHIDLRNQTQVFKVGSQCLYLLCPQVELLLMPSRPATLSPLFGQAGKAAFLVPHSSPWVPMLFLESLGLKGGLKTSRAWLDSKFPFHFGPGRLMTVLCSYRDVTIKS